MSDDEDCLVRLEINPDDQDEKERFRNLMMTELQNNRIQESLGMRI